MGRGEVATNETRTTAVIVCHRMFPMRVSPIGSRVPVGALVVTGGALMHRDMVVGELASMLRMESYPFIWRRKLRGS